jgi:hypothetical protein
MGISLRDARQGESSGTAKSKICQFLNDITSENTRSPKEIRKYKNKKIKFDFCPVTRRLLHRFARAAGPIPKEQAGKGKGKGTKSYDVFVSFGHGDEKLAAKVARHIKKHCGKKVFYYPISQTDHDFYRAIDRALESAQCLVAVGSSLEHLTARWPEYEYRTFNLEMLGPRKPNGKLLSLVVGIDPNNLPLPLRSFIVTSCQNEAGLPKALEKLLKYLPKKGSKKISMKGSKKVSGDSSAVNNPTSLV